MTKKPPVSGMILTPVAQIWVSKNFFYGFYLYSMLVINASYHCMQFQGKRMNQTRENDWKPSFSLDFDPIWHKFDPPIFLCGVYLNYMLYILASFHCMQFQGKLMNQTWENGKKPSLGLGSLWPKFGPKIFLNGFYLYQMLDIVASYLCMQFQGKLMN